MGQLIHHNGADKKLWQISDKIGGDGISEARVQMEVEAQKNGYIIMELHDDNVHDGRTGIVVVVEEERVWR